MLENTSDASPTNKMHDFPDTDSFSDSFTSSSSDTSLLPSPSSVTSSFSGEGSGSGADSSRSEKRLSRVLDEQPAPELTAKSLSKPSSAHKQDKSLQNLQRLRERRRSSLLGLKDGQHSAEEVVGHSSRVAAEEIKLRHQISTGIIHHDPDTVKTPELPLGIAHVQSEEARPAHPLLNSVALPSTSAWILSQSQVALDKQRTSKSATDPTLFPSMPGMHNAAHQQAPHTSDTPPVVRCLAYRPDPAQRVLFMVPQRSEDYSRIRLMQQER